MTDRNPTLAELCLAIADGHLSADVEGKSYEVKINTFRRYLERPRIEMAGPLAILLEAIPEPRPTKTLAHAHARL